MVTILKFKDREKVKRRVARYLEDPSLISKDGKGALSTLVKGFKTATKEERKKMFLVLSTLAQDELCWILHSLIEDPETSDELKDQAAIYLSVIGSFVSNPHLLTTRLNDIVRSGEKDSAIRAIIAMGWEGNTQAVPILAELLHDPDPEIQEVAVIAMTNLQDSRLFGILVDRLQTAPDQQKTAILYNLWRFPDKQEEAFSIYLRTLANGESELIADILSIISEMDENFWVPELFQRMLDHNDPKVRHVAATALYEHGDLTPEMAQRLMNDPNMDVKRIALKALGK